MISLRNRWRRSWLYNYFAIMEPVDRATALIAVLLAAAIAACFSAIAHSQEAATPLPRLTAPPFLMDFAVARPFCASA